MRVCGCEISAQEVRLAVVFLNDDSNVEMLRLKTTRIVDLSRFSAAPGSHLSGLSLKSQGAFPTQC
jgi:hypothetical protein